MTRDPYWIKDFYLNMSLIKSISFRYDVIYKKESIFGSIRAILELCDCKLVRIDDKFYIRYSKRTTYRIHFWGIYQVATLFSSTCIYFPKADCGIKLDNRNKLIHITNISNFSSGNLLHKLIDHKVVFRDTSDIYYEFKKTSKTINIDTSEIIKI